ncbi:unnamed protein product [Caenorhabditis bovis]|nr:unnamed protein product [Caenorhabditis bovis]
MMRANHRKELGNISAERFQTELEDWLVPISNKIQLISVFPISFICNIKNESVHTYPVEISIATLDFQSGLTDTKTIQVLFDHKAYYGENAGPSNPNFLADQATIEAYSSCLGIPQSGPEDGLTPTDANAWVFRHIDMDAILLCDTKQYVWVTRGLETLAIMSGRKAVLDYKKYIGYLKTVQDFAAIVLSKSPTNIPNSKKWGLDEIENEFLNNYLRVGNHRLCDFHATLSEDSIVSKYQCCAAHNTRLAHVLFDIFSKNQLQHFKPIGDTFELCQLERGEIAPLPMEPNISKQTKNILLREQEEIDRLQAEVEEFVLPKPVISLCTEMTSKCTTSDESDSDDDSNGKGLLYSSEAAASAFYGSPQVPFIRQSHRPRVLCSQQTDQAYISKLNAIQPPTPTERDQPGPSTPRRLPPPESHVLSKRNEENILKEFVLPVNENRRVPIIKEVLDAEATKKYLQRHRRRIFDDAFMNGTHAAFIEKKIVDSD